MIIMRENTPVETMQNKDILENVGNTPLREFVVPELPLINLFIKLEGCNPTGSVKDRPAHFILKKELENGTINAETLIIESSSGNLGIALASYCKKFGLRFCCVIDKNISPFNETILRSLCPEVIKITEPDENGGYLLNRIRKISELKRQIKNGYWVNQYANPYNAEAHYKTLGVELCQQLKKIDYVFVGVSSGGTVTGLSRRMKEEHPETKIIAVDSWGSVIFGGAPQKRYIPGIGSSMVPSILKEAKIDEVVSVTEDAAIRACRDFKKKHSMLIGGSSGSVFAAIKKYFADKKNDDKPNIVAIFADRGERYMDTIYNDAWCMAKFNLKKDDLS